MEQKLKSLLEDAKVLPSKLDRVEFAAFYQDMDTFTNREDRIKILRLWLKVTNDKEGNDPNPVKQKKYLKNMEELGKFRRGKMN
ncbi:MAG: hypothetical protein OXM55_04670 [Bdellovibrionales bacterium]|nr:hypothetical protein [Bdellovibrionales bacterium]